MPYFQCSKIKLPSRSLLYVGGISNPHSMMKIGAADKLKDAERIARTPAEQLGSLKLDSFAFLATWKPSEQWMSREPIGQRKGNRLALWWSSPQAQDEQITRALCQFIVNIESHKSLFGIGLPREIMDARKGRRSAKIIPVTDLMKELREPIAKAERAAFVAAFSETIYGGGMHGGCC